MTPRERAVEDNPGTRLQEMTRPLLARAEPWQSAPQQQGQAGRHPPTSLPDLSAAVETTARILAQELAHRIGHQSDEPCLASPVEVVEWEGQEPAPGVVYDLATLALECVLEGALDRALSRLAVKVRDFGPRRFHLLPPPVAMEAWALGFAPGLCLRVCAYRSLDPRVDLVLHLDVAVSRA